MKLAIQVEQLESQGFRASVGHPWNVQVEAPSRDEAIARLKQSVEERAANSGLVEIDISLPSEPNPWAAICGSWRDHPDQADFEANIREYRQQLEAGPSKT